MNENEHTITQTHPKHKNKHIQVQSCTLSYLLTHTKCKIILKKCSKTVHFLSSSCCIPLCIGLWLLPLSVQLLEVPERSLVHVAVELFVIKQAVMLLVAWRRKYYEKVKSHYYIVLRMTPASLNMVNSNNPTC